MKRFLARLLRNKVGVLIAPAVCLFLAYTPAFSQPDLIFKPVSDNPVVNTFDFSLDEKKLKQMHAVQGKKISLPVEEAMVNNRKVPVERLRIRGSTSSHYYRKSFNIVLGEMVSFADRDTLSVKLKKLYAICLNMDRNYIRNRIAYAVLAEQGITIPPNVYVHVMANSKSEGIYLFFYPPADYALKECQSPFVIRRGYESSIKKTYEKNLPSEEAKSLSQLFYSVYKKTLSRYKGQELYEQLNAVIDMEKYFTWMAFNHLFQNGDYTDEVYFMWNKDRQKYELIPWDFDDLFQMKPHAETPVLKNKLIFSIEDRLDETIANDTYLYTQYLIVYQRFLDTFTREKLKDVLEDVYGQILPYFMQEGILAQTRYDKYGQTDIDNLKKDINNIYLNLYVRMDFMKKELNKLLPR